jgi:hypothetical protein
LFLDFSSSSSVDTIIDISIAFRNFVSMDRVQIEQQRKHTSLYLLIKLQHTTLATEIDSALCHAARGLRTFDTVICRAAKFVDLL